MTISRTVRNDETLLIVSIDVLRRLVRAVEDPGSTGFAVALDIRLAGSRACPVVLPGFGANLHERKNGNHPAISESLHLDDVCGGSLFNSANAAAAPPPREQQTRCWNTFRSRFTVLWASVLRRI